MADVPLTMNDLKAYLAVDGAPAPYTDDEIADVFSAELAAQRAVCRFPQAFAGEDGELVYVSTPDLAEALLRRVAHNLAVRKLPLGVQGSLTEGSAPIRVGGTDAEVRRLEAPWRRLVVG